MSEVSKIIYTSVVTLIGGVILLVIGQLITRLFIDPLLKLRSIIGDIAFNLIYYANIMGNYDDTDTAPEKEKLKEAKNSFRKLAAEFKVAAYVLPCYRLFYWMRLIPSEKNILEATPNLTGLSNTGRTTSPESTERRLNHSALKVQRFEQD
jgi:hypothetical protein